MRVLFEMTHPTDVHVYKHTIRELEGRGHETAITARDKDVLLALLRAYGFEFECLSARRSGMLGLARELLVRDWRLWRFARRFRPDVLVGFVGTCAAHVGWLLRRPVLVVDNTEHASLQQRITFPFATRICTAYYYQKDLGAKQKRFHSFEHLAYLHPSRFSPDPAVLRQAGLAPGDRFVIVRFVSWEAAHDVHRHGIQPGMRLALLEHLERYGRVLVTSERALPPEFDRYRFPVAPEHFHDVLAFASLCVGDGGTVAAEAAVLGVPSIFVSHWRIGYNMELEERYGLLRHADDESVALKVAEDLMADEAIRDRWSQGRAKMLSQQEDLTAWLVREIESFGPAADKERGA